MPKTLEEIIKILPPEEVKKIEARAQELFKEHNVNRKKKILYRNEKK